MTSEEAKVVLGAYRPGDDSAAVRDALAHAKTDKGLAAWLAEQQAFDKAMSQAVLEQSVPRELKALILQEQPLVTGGASYASPRAGFRPNRRMAVGLALVAAALLTGAVLTMLHHRASRSVDDFRIAMVQELWGDLGEHVTFTSSDVGEVRQWLKSKGACDDLVIPAAVQDMRIRGARVVNWSDQKVASLCLLGNGKHLHLFVVPTATLDTASLADMPDFEKCNGWRTVAWTYGENTYLLGGMNFLAFIKKSRHAGQWRFASASPFNHNEAQKTVAQVGRNWSKSG
jgi:hypothetical protein